MNSPWDDPKDPRPRGFGSPEMAAWIQRNDMRREAWYQTPEGLTQRAKEETERRTKEAKELRHEIESRYSKLHIPYSADLLPFVMLPNPSAVTSAMQAFDDAVSWRHTRRTKVQGNVSVLRVVGGGPGCGKTVGMCRTLLHKRGSLFVQAHEIVSKPESFSDNTHLWNRWLGDQMIGIDDMGTERGDPTILQSLLTRRYNDGLTTLVTTNLDVSDFAKRYLDPRLVSRVVNGQGAGGMEGGLPWYVDARGPDLRHPVARQKLIHGAGIQSQDNN